MRYNFDRFSQSKMYTGEIITYWSNHIAWFTLTNKISEFSSCPGFSQDSRTTYLHFTFWVGIFENTILPDFTLCKNVYWWWDYYCSNHITWFTLTSKINEFHFSPGFNQDLHIRVGIKAVELDYYCFSGDHWKYNFAWITLCKNVDWGDHYCSNHIFWNWKIVQDVLMGYWWLKFKSHLIIWFWLF